MLAVRFYGAGDLRVEEVAEPDGDLGPTELLVRPQACGICGSDLREYRAGPIEVPTSPHPLTGAKLPQILGHEFSADVLTAGTAVTAATPGDRVAVMPAIYCGTCAYCRSGLQQMCARAGCIGESSNWGGMAELAVVDEYQVTRLPDGVSYIQGALIEPAAVAVNAVGRVQVKVGHTALVTGAGPIGALSVLACRAAGAGHVFLSEPNPERASRAGALGAHILDPTSTGIVDEIRDRTDGLGVDVALECSGHPDALRTCLTATRTRGTVGQVGLHMTSVPIDMVDLTTREITLVGVYAYAVDDFPRIIGLVESGALPVERIVTSSVPIERAIQGFDALLDRDGAEIKVLVSEVVPSHGLTETQNGGVKDAP